jgi:hypothetical protein
MADVAAVEASLKAKLLTVAGLREAHDVWPDQINVPCAIVRTPSGDYDETFDDGATVHAEVLLLAAPAGQGFGQGQRALDPYLASSGAKSVKAALDDGQTRVTGWRDKGTMEVNGLPYVGVRLLVEVLA